MRRQRAVFVTFVLSIVLTATARAADQRGIEVGDLNRSVDPCTDFFEYANGTWRANNPIPAYMDRWSRRWASGEINKDQLHTILDEVSIRKDWPAGSHEQLIAVTYGACMDQAQIDKLGVAPAQPMLREIDGMKSREDLGKMIGRLHAVGIGVPFGIAASPDNHDPTRVIADVYASGLGMPDRDYYLKPEPRFVEAREKYRAHVKNMFALAGEGADAAQAAPTRCSPSRRSSRRPRSTTSPYATRGDRPQGRVRRARQMVSHFDWDAYFRAAKIPRSRSTCSSRSS
jgi:endothelin-converting enzyme/putative endopeptidase